MSLCIRSREHRVAGHPILGKLAVHRKIRSIARQTENWLRAEIYVTAAATSTRMPASIRRRLLHWVIVALVEALNGSLSKVCRRGLAAVRALETWMQVVDAPDAESDGRFCDILRTAMAVFRGTDNPQGCPVFCVSSGGASAASRSVLRSAAFSSFFLCFSSVRARAALCRSARSRR